MRRTDASLFRRDPIELNPTELELTDVLTTCSDAGGRVPSLRATYFDPSPQRMKAFLPRTPLWAGCRPLRQLGPAIAAMGTSQVVEPKTRTDGTLTYPLSAFPHWALNAFRYTS